jgi:hypothetical protein
MDSLNPASDILRLASAVAGAIQIAPPPSRDRRRLRRELRPLFKQEFHPDFVLIKVDGSVKVRYRSGNMVELDHTSGVLHGGKTSEELFVEPVQPEPPSAKAPDISIQDAAGDGNIEAVKQHLAAGADVNANPLRRSSHQQKWT